MPLGEVSPDTLSHVDCTMLKCYLSFGRFRDKPTPDIKIAPGLRTAGCCLLIPCVQSYFSLGRVHVPVAISLCLSLPLYLHPFVFAYLAACLLSSLFLCFALYIPRRFCVVLPDFSIELHVLFFLSCCLSLCLLSFD